jgi:putative glutamine amidotransferase
MKRLFLTPLIIFLFVLTAFTGSTVPATGKKTLLIMHPTVGTISGITWLIDHGIFPIKDVQLKGVCHVRENSDYDASDKYIKEHGLSMVIERITDSISSGNLFGVNPCCEDFERLFRESAGVIFFGGPDIPPAVYGEKTNTLTVITDPYRHFFEVSFLFHLLGGSQNLNYSPLLESRPDYLVVGFCLGMQTINVATGGTLIQDIPLEVYHLQNVEDILSLPRENMHRNYYSDLEDAPDLFWGNVHPVKFSDDSRFVKSGILKPGQSPGVVSSHHQAIEKPGLNIKITGRSADGLIPEAIEHTKFPNVFAFQFHPEVPDIYNYDNSYRFRLQDEPESLRSMIEKARGYDFHIEMWKKTAEILNKKDPR